MGKHSAPKRSRDRIRGEHIERLEPASTSSETPAARSRRTGRPSFGERQRRAQRRRRAALGCAGAIAVGFVVLMLAGFVYVRVINAKLSENIKADERVVELLEEDKPEKRSDPFYMLIMGVDNREGETRARSDTLIVARVDPVEERATLLSIPRDTRVEIPDHGRTKINAANALGGPALVIETVREFTGLPISHYVEVDFSGFKDMVDALGGVTVDVPNRINDMKAANYVKSASVIEPGVQKLNGAQALTFVRTRNYPEGDIARIRNQQAFLRALVGEATRLANALKLPGLVSAFADNVTTDLNVTQLLRLANEMKGVSSDGLETVTMPGEPKYIGGVSYVLTDEEEFRAMLDRIEQGLPAEVSEEATVTPMPYQITISVRNGAGINGVAADAQARLEALEFDVREIGNMNQFVYDETLVVYKDEELKADTVVEALGAGRPVASRGMYSFTTDILLVVGKDWQPSASSGQGRLDE